MFHVLAGPGQQSPGPLPRTVSIYSTSACVSNCLYVANAGNNTWAQFGAPLSSASTPRFTKNFPSIAGIVANNLYLAVTDSTSRKAYVYKQPVTASSGFFASWNVSGGAGFGRFDTSGNLWFPDGDNQVQEFKPPFSYATKAALTVTKDVVGPVAVAFDSSGNMYVAQIPMGPCCPPFEVLRFAPPYTGTPVVNTHALIASGAAVHGSQLVISGDVAQVRECNCGALQVYTLPITAASTPTIQVSMAHGEPWDPSFDPSGNLYVPWVSYTNSTSGVDVFRSPLTTSSKPVFTITNGVNFPIQTAFGP